jgi:uncharacterized membrane protein
MMQLPLSKKEEQLVIAAIQSAERGTSGEIRVHFQRRVNGNLLETAQRTFLKLGMQNTRLRNAALIVVFLESKKFAILGDKGINDVVPDNFWDETCSLMGSFFRQGKMADGLCAGVAQIGEKLKAFFPAGEENPNELDDTLTMDVS